MLKRGGLILLGARPNMGKTALALSITRHLLQEQKTILYFSLECAEWQLKERLKMQEEDRLFNNCEEHLIIDDTPNISVYELCEKCARQKENGLDLIIIDKLQLLGLPCSEQEYSEVSTILRRLAEELEIPIIVLSTVSVIFRKDKRPILSDLVGESAFIQDAHIIGFIYRDSYYNHSTENIESAELIIAKNEYGENGTVLLKFNRQFIRFECE